MSPDSGVVQGSGLGPTSHAVGASGLKTIHHLNHLIKYADDTYLIIGSSQVHTAVEEFEHISDWASANNLRLNKSRTREMVFSRRASIKLWSSPRQSEL